MAAQIPIEQNPEFVAPISTPAFGAGGVTSVVFSTIIASSPAICLAIMLDPTTYTQWNRWVQRVVIDSPSSIAAVDLPASLSHLHAAQESNPLILPGARCHFEVHMNPQSSSFTAVDLEVTVLESFELAEVGRGLRVAWKSPGSPWHLRAERVQEFIETVDGGCRYVSYETFFGPVAWLVKYFAGKQLLEGLVLWRDGLKKVAEARTQATKEEQVNAGNRAD